MKKSEKKELEERRLTEKVSHNVEQQLLKRYSIYGAIATIVVGTLITLIVKDNLSEARVKLEAAEQLQTLMVNQLTESTTEIKKLSEQTNGTIKKFTIEKEKARNKFDEINTKANRLTTELANSAKSNIEIVSNLQKKLKELTRVTSDIVKRQGNSIENRDSLISKINDIESSLVNYQKTINRAKVTATLLDFPIQVRNSIWNFPKRNTLISELISSGFSIEDIRGLSSNPKEDYVGLVIPSTFPLDRAKELIEITHKYWPFIRYLLIDIRGKRTVIGWSISEFKKKKHYEKNFLSDKNFKALLAPHSNENEFQERLDKYKVNLKTNDSQE